MKKSKILYIIIFLVIILFCGFFIKKHFDNQALQDQLDDLDVPSGTQIDDNSENSSNDDLSKLKMKGYIISINNGNVDLEELMKKTNEPMELIAQKCGFTTQSTFNRNFRKFLDTSPYQWKINPENYEHKLLNFRISALKGW